MVFDLENFICSTKMGRRKADTVPTNQSEPVDKASTGSGWSVRTFELRNEMILNGEWPIIQSRKNEVRINKSERLATVF